MPPEKITSFEDFRSIRVKLFEEFVIEDYPSLNESSDPNDIFSDFPQSLKEKIAKRKVVKALQWIGANKRFFAKLLLKVSVYGSSDPRYTTMCTNGFSIQYHPQFVLNQSEAALRFVLCHEILHCAGNHMSRMGKRNPQLWNIACDYSINQILDAEVSSDASNFNWPKNSESTRQGKRWNEFKEKNPEEISNAPIGEYPFWDGSIMGICGSGSVGSMVWPEKFRNRNAETIYKILEEDANLRQEALKEARRAYGGEEGQEGIHVVPASQNLSSPDSQESIVRDMGQESEEEQPTPGGQEGQPTPGGQEGQPTPGGQEGQPTPGKGTPGEDQSKDSKESGEGSKNLIGRKIRVTSGPNSGKIGIVRQVLPEGDIIIDVL